MSHTYTKLMFHRIFATKGRRAFIKPTLRDRLYAYMGGILREHNARLLVAGGTEDHVHLLMELPGAFPVADAMRFVKANSSKWFRETFADAAAFGWQTGYGAFTVSASVVDEVTSYIRRQEEHHRTRTFAEEMAEFLRRHGIEYDERYVMD